MGLFDKLKEKGRGVVTAAKPEDGVEPQSADEVRDRLLAISGKGIQTGVDDGEIVVAWSAKVSGSGMGSAGTECLYRALRIKLDESDHEAEGIGTKATSEAELTIGGDFSGSVDWERGQHMGSEIDARDRLARPARTPRAAPTSPATSSPGRTCVNR